MIYDIINIWKQRAPSVGAHGQALSVFVRSLIVNRYVSISLQVALVIFVVCVLWVAGKKWASICDPRNTVPDPATAGATGARPATAPAPATPPAPGAIKPPVKAKPDGPKFVGEALRKGLRETVPARRVRAVKAVDLTDVDDLDCAEVVAILIALFKDEDGDVRTAALETLQRLGTKAHPALVAVVDSADPQEAEMAIGCLYNQGTTAFPVMLRKYSVMEDTPGRAILEKWILKMANDPATRAAVVALLNAAKDDKDRMYAQSARTILAEL